MRATKCALFMRAGAACAAAAVLIGGTFTAGAATAAPSSDAAPTPISSASTTTEPAGAASALPNGLAEAVERDLGMSVEEFNAQSALAAKAADVQDEVAKADPGAVVSLSGDTINVKASAPQSAKTGATSVAALLAAYTAEFGVRNLQAIMVNSNGDYVIRTGEAAQGGPAPTARRFAAPAQPAVADFAAKYTNVVIESASGPATALATDVTNGQGYLLRSGQRAAVCSIGWNGFDPAGKAAVLSAGHCADDGAATNTMLTVPAQDDAGKPATPGPAFEAELGTFGISQFGGPNNSPATAPADWDEDLNTLDNIGTDISVIGAINPDLNPLAKVTDWTTPQAPKNSGPVVTGVSTAVPGTPVCKSGRTTGWTCGTVTMTGVFLVAGLNYANDMEDVRAVRGFGATDLEAGPGDSGGAIIAGTLAVGVTSAGIAGEISYGTDLVDALAHIPGYSVKIFLAAPEITTTAPVHRKDPVTGTVANAPAGSTVTVTIDGVVTDVAVGSDGSWSAEAPTASGTYSVTAQTRNGYSTSATTQASLEVLKETLPTPTLTAPALNGAVAAPLTVLTGTGQPGATVEVSGGATGGAVVDAAGNWSLTLGAALDGGSYTVTATAKLAGWNDSAPATYRFSVIPAAPATTSPANGQEFAFNEGPSVISGTNAAGAAVSVTIAGSRHDAAVVGGTWSVTLNGKLPSGDYTVSAVQTVANVASPAGASAFTVLAAPVLTPARVAVIHDLANTGVSSPTLLLGGAGVLVLLGGAAFLVTRRRSAK